MAVNHSCYGALSYAQSVITTSQGVRIATIKILFAYSLKNCKIYEIWGLKMASEAIS